MIQAQEAASTVRKKIAKADANHDCKILPILFIGLITRINYKSEIK